jgi:hypothetical protein
VSAAKFLLTKTKVSIGQTILVARMLVVPRAHTLPGSSFAEGFLCDAGGSVDGENFEYDNDVGEGESLRFA